MKWFGKRRSAGSGPGEARIESRAQALTAEEGTSGTDDAHALAAAVLAESDERQADRDRPADQPVERRRSEETVEPPP